MRKIIIHKNKLANIFLVGGREGLKKSRIGKEKYIRWVDIPEYVEIRPDFEWVAVKK